MGRRPTVTLPVHRITCIYEGEKERGGEREKEREKERE